MRGEWAMERVTLSLARSLIWSLVGREQLHRSRGRVQRERKNLLSCPADTFKSYQSKEEAWKESRVMGEGAAIGPNWHGRAALQRCRVRPTSAKRGRYLKAQNGWKSSLDEVQSQGEQPQSLKSLPKACSAWQQFQAAGTTTAAQSQWSQFIMHRMTCGWCSSSSKARNIQLDYTVASNYKSERKLTMQIKDAAIKLNVWKPQTTENFKLKKIY